MAAETVGEAWRPDREIFAKLDPQVLDCTICSEPLNPPIFQVIITRTICRIYFYY
jgi:E3 ubiquitin-protein ligase SIAH1